MFDSQKTQRFLPFFGVAGEWNLDLSTFAGAVRMLVGIHVAGPRRRWKRVCAVSINPTMLSLLGEPKCLS